MPKEIRFEFIDCNIRYKVKEENIESFTLGFKVLPRIGEVFQYSELRFEVINIQHHQIMENQKSVETDADVTLYVKEVTISKDLYGN